LVTCYIIYIYRKFLCILFILYFGGNVVLIIWNPAIGLIVLASVIVILMVCVACGGYGGDSHNVRPQLPHHHGYSSENGGIVDGIAAVGGGVAAVDEVVASFGDSGGGGGGGDGGGGGGGGGCGGGCGG
jgi:hypothetical protein